MTIALCASLLMMCVMQGAAQRGGMRFIDCVIRIDQHLDVWLDRQWDLRLMVGSSLAVGGILSAATGKTLEWCESPAFQADQQKQLAPSLLCYRSAGWASAGALFCALPRTTTTIASMTLGRAVYSSWQQEQASRREQTNEKNFPRRSEQ